jgi:hypothetical protein
MMFSARFKHSNPSHGAPEYHQIRNFHDFGRFELGCSPIILPIRTNAQPPALWVVRKNIFRENFSKKFQISYPSP